MKIYIVPGYGIPKDILCDEHYNWYLQTIFNSIFDESQNKVALIIFSGGKTDMFKPYGRTEAGEMKRFFIQLMKRSFVKEAVDNWKIETDFSALSSLENILNSKQIITLKKVKTANVTLFCEWSRSKKMRILSRKVFGRNITVYPVDFDVSQNRYQSELVRKKEAEDIKFSLWALKSPENLRMYKKVFKDKIIWLRKQKGTHPEAVKKWWQMKLKELEESKNRAY